MNRLSLLIFSACTLLLQSASADDSPVSFRQHIAPLLFAKCEACHGEKVQKGDFRLDTFHYLMDAGDSGDGYISPGKPANSHLLDLIVSNDRETRMPKDAPPLPKEQIEFVRRWIADGAKFDGVDPNLPLAEIMTPPKHPTPPTAYVRPLPVTAIAFSPDGKEIASSGFHEVLIWNAADGKLLRRIHNIASRTYALAYSADGQTLAVGSGDSGKFGEVRLFNPQNGELLKIFVTLRDSVLDVKFSHDGKLLAAASADRTIRVFDVATGERKNLIVSHGDAVTAITFSPDGKRLAAVSLDRAAKVHDLATNKVTASYADHTGPLYSVAFSPDGRQVLSSGKEKTIRVWNAADGKKVADIPGIDGDVLKLIVVGNDLFTAGGERRVRQFTAATRAQVKAFDPMADWIYAIAVDPIGRQVAAGCYDGQIRVWSFEDGKQKIDFAAQGHVP